MMGKFLIRCTSVLQITFKVKESMNNFQESIDQALSKLSHTGFSDFLT